MSEHGGVLSAAKEGAVPGLFIGVLVGSSRAYLNARDLAKETEAITTAAAQANPSISRAAINSLRPSPLPALAMTTATYAGLGAVYTGVGALAENIRATDDMWNRVIGAMTAGSLVGLRTGSLYTSGGAAAALGFMSAAVYLCGGEFGPHDDGVLERRRAMYED